MLWVWTALEQACSSLQECTRRGQVWYIHCSDLILFPQFRISPGDSVQVSGAARPDHSTQCLQQLQALLSNFLCQITASRFLLSAKACIGWMCLHSSQRRAGSLPQEAFSQWPATACVPSLASRGHRRHYAGCTWISLALYMSPAIRNAGVISLR